jgi:hypothetical protein
VSEHAAPRCPAKAPQIRSLAETLRVEVPECRSKKALAYLIAGMLALIALAMFSGVRHGPQDLADYAATLSQGQLRALGFRRDRHTGRIRCPGVTPFRDVLAAVDTRALQRARLCGQEQLLGPAQDRLVMVEGKALWHAHVELVSAVNGRGRWLGTVTVAEGRNEIPAARDLLAQVDVTDKTALADALHTQTETVQQILFERRRPLRADRQRQPESTGPNPAPAPDSEQITFNPFGIFPAMAFGFPERPVPRVIRDEHRVGGGVTPAVPPHHRTYGSVSRRLE